MSTDLRAKCAIAGLGQTRMGKNFDHPNAMGFAVEAIELALADAGLERSDLDGLLVNPGVTWMENAMASFSLQQAMGLTDLTLTATMNLGGATAGAMIMHATQAIAAGMANVVACVFADAPLRPPSPDKNKATGGSAAAYGFARGLNAHYGQFGVNAAYAFVAQRHMYLYGTKQEHLGAIAVSERDWANLNPAAQFHDTPMTMADYNAARWVVEPFHLYDCCLVSNGGLAVIVTSAERAKSLKHPPVYILGMGQGHPGGDPMDTLVSGAPLAKKTAFKMARNRAWRYQLRRALRLLHLHRAGDARGLRFLQKRRGRPIRRGRPYRTQRIAPGKYRRRTAQLILYVGDDSDR